MKTKLFLFAAIAAATVMMTSCNNDDEVIDNNAPVEIRLSSANLASRGVAQDLQLTQFENNEKIGVFINENAASPTTTYPQPLEYTANGTGGMTPGTQPYFPQSGNGVNINAFYPYTAAESLTMPKVFNIKTDQSANADYKASDLMYGVPAANPVARTTGNVQLTFNHLLSKIDIELTSGDGNPTIVGATVKLKGIKPQTTFNPLTGSIAVAEGGATDIMVMTTDALLKGSAIIVPQAIAQGAAFIEVTLPAGGVLTHKLDAATTFEGKKQYTYKIRVNLTKLTVTSTINAWTPAGGTTTGTAELPPPTIDLTAQPGDVYTVTEDCIIDGGGTLLAKRIVIDADLKVTLKDVVLQSPNNDTAGITCQGNTTITLQGTNNIKGHDTPFGVASPGILVTASTLTLTGTDADFLTAVAGTNHAAGIDARNGANITITGGIITANGGHRSTGIGSSYYGNSGDITISGGTITANGGGSAAGIGSGDHGTCGDITISGGTITANGGGYYAAGIGSGYSGNSGYITISGASTKVIATKGTGAPNSIGAGLNGTCGVVTIGSESDVTQQ